MIRESERVALHRAERFTLALAVRYKRRGTDHWTDGLSVNISRTGVLFNTAEAPLSCGAEVDFLVHLPAIEGASGGAARCFGRVARVVLPVAAGDQPAIAVTIDHYVLAPESDALRERESDSRRRGPPGRGG